MTALYNVDAIDVTHRPPNPHTKPMAYSDFTSLDQLTPLGISQLTPVEKIDVIPSLKVT